MSTTKVKFTSKAASPEDLEKLEAGSALTMTGYLPEELHLYVEVISPYVNVDELTVFTYTSEQLNSARGTTLPTGLNMFSVSLADLKDINVLAIKERMQYGFRWLDDVCDNNRPAPVEMDEEDEE